MKSPTRSHFAASLVGGAVVAGTLLVLGVTGNGTTETIIEGSPFAAQPAATGTRLTAHAIYERDAPGVVFVRAQIDPAGAGSIRPVSPQERSVSTGSGFLIDGTGDILTNYHVIEGANRSDGVTVQFEDNVIRTAAVVDRDPTTTLPCSRSTPRACPRSTRWYWATRRPSRWETRRSRSATRSGSIGRSPAGSCRRSSGRSRARAGSASTTSSRPTRRSTPVTPAVRCSTPPAA